jgi:hypothetical protein
VNPTRWQCKKKLGIEKGKGYTSLYNGIDRADEKLMKLLPLRWNEGRKRGSAAGCNDVSKKFSVSQPEVVQDDMTQSKLMRTGYLEANKTVELNWNLDAT